MLHKHLSLNNNKSTIQDFMSRTQRLCSYTDQDLVFLTMAETVSKYGGLSERLLQVRRAQKVHKQSRQACVTRYVFHIGLQWSYVRSLTERNHQAKCHQDLPFSRDFDKLLVPTQCLRDYSKEVDYFIAVLFEFSAIIKATL